MNKISKRYSQILEKIDQEKIYNPIEAIKIVKENANTKFDETVELHINTSLDNRHADQQLRTSVALPNGLGKTIKIAVVVEGEAAAKAKEAGADAVGGEDLIKELKTKASDFDVIIAERGMMGKLAQIGKILGPKGLMPNPKNNTVLAENDIANGIKEAKSGRVEIKLDKANIIHCTLGKASFSNEQLLENFSSIMDTISKNKPSGAKGGSFIKSSTICSSMGPGIKLNQNKAE
ncbi:MAG: 50S ribosomal protein L1 [Dehalococcoidia bacterium]|jgi:large subunit ribosomal protein L1|nr:MAG: large subunit ribosomal protein L1 [Chloroflexota bacterium]